MSNQIVKIKLPDVRQEVTLAGEWFASRDLALAESAQITAVDAQSADLAGKSISELGKMASQIEKQRKDITAPFLQAQRAIKAVVDKAKKPLDDEVDRLKGLVAEFAEAERKRLAEEARQAELARIEAMAAEAARIEAEQAIFGAADEVITVESEPEIKASPKFDGVRLSEAVAFEVIDENLIPTAFLTFDERKLRAWINERKAELLEQLKHDSFRQPIAGIVLKIESKVAIR